MRENEKERELLKACYPKTLLVIPKKVPFYSDAWDLYIAQSQAKLQKTMNQPLLHKGQFRQK